MDKLPSGQKPPRVLATGVDRNAFARSKPPSRPTERQEQFVEDEQWEFRSLAVPAGDREIDVNELNKLGKLGWHIGAMSQAHQIAGGNMQILLQRRIRGKSWGRPAEKRPAEATDGGRYGW